MFDVQQIFSSFVAFLITASKDWSMYTIPFMVTFLLFFAIYIGIGRYRRAWMRTYVILFSLFFAYKANGTLMFLLPTVTLVSWYLTKKMMRLRRGKPRKIGLAILILIELFPLLYYKYTNFAIDIVNSLLQTNFAPSELLLPIGISFYSFQAISYTIDVYKEKFPKTTGFLDYCFYLTFFPLLIAGPITRAEVLIPQIQGHKEVDKNLVYKGLWLIICGLLKKGLVADYLAQFNNWIFTDPLAYSGLENLMGVLGYSLQIYCDFSGYSDMAIGIAAMLGFSIPNNFSFPYQSLNLTEFWHRWHIALSSWFRDYVYIPLGGNRRGNARTYLNSFITMVVAGLWHGASGMFVVWGMLHGIGLIAHKFFNNNGLRKIPCTLLVKIISWLITFSYVTFAWIFFRSPSLETANELLSNIWNNFRLADLYPFLMARPVWLILLAVGLELHSIRESDYQWMEQKFVHSHWIVKFLIFTIILQIVINFSQDYVQPFIYTQF